MKFLQPGGRGGESGPGTSLGFKQVQAPDANAALESLDADDNMNQLLDMMAEIMQEQKEAAIYARRQERKAALAPKQKPCAFCGGYH
jgi:hypothetical protein